MAKKSETVKATLRFVDLTECRTAVELARLPLQEMQEALEKQEIQARKNATAGGLQAELLAHAKAGAVISVEVTGMHRGFL